MSTEGMYRVERLTPFNVRAAVTSFYQPKAQAMLAIVTQPYFGNTTLKTKAPPVGRLYAAESSGFWAGILTLKKGGDV